MVLIGRRLKPSGLTSNAGCDDVSMVAEAILWVYHPSHTLNLQEEEYKVLTKKKNGFHTYVGLSAQIHWWWITSLTTWVMISPSICYRKHFWGNIHINKQCPMYSISHVPYCSMLPALMAHRALLSQLWPWSRWCNSPIEISSQEKAKHQKQGVPSPKQTLNINISDATTYVSLRSRGN